MAVRIAVALAVAGPTSAGAAGVQEETIQLWVGSNPLVGTLALPEGSGEVPGVVFIPGSGPVDRNGNFPGGLNDHLKLLAQGLAAQGIASLRIDKRGIGESRSVAPQEEDLRFHDYVLDAVHWLDRLRAVPRMGRVFLLGHSEGALIATLAAQQVHPNGLILIAGASTSAGVAIRRQLEDADVAPELRAAADRILNALERKETVSDVPPELAALFRPSVQGYVMSWLPFDPVAELAQVQAPVLVVQGTTDIQVTVEDARRLAAARPGIELVTIEGMNHILKAAPADRASNISTYNDPSRPLMPGLIPPLVKFIRGR